MIEEVTPQWFSAIGRNTSPSATSQPNATPTPTSHQTTRFSGWRRNPTRPITRNGNGPTTSQVGLRTVAAGHGHREGGEDHPAPERRERGDYGPHASIVGVICGESAMRPTGISPGGSPHLAGANN